VSIARRVFPQLNEAEEQEVLSVCTRITAPAGTPLFRKDDGGGDLYIVESGMFKVYEDEKGEEFVLALLNPGDVFGELSFLDGSPRSASVRAQSDGILLKLERSAIPSLVLKNPYAATRLLFSLASIVSARLRQADEALANLAFGQNEASCEELHSLAAEMHRAVFTELSGHRGDQT
jgi:CRP/FNR family cyclic AMP-dependent transcriptional regulator